MEALYEFIEQVKGRPYKKNPAVFSHMAEEMLFLAIDRDSTEVGRLPVRPIPSAARGDQRVRAQLTLLLATEAISGP